MVGRPDFAMMGLGLEGERLGEILHKNFLRFLGDAARPADPEAVLALIRRTRRELVSAARLPGFVPDSRGLDAAERIFTQF